MPKKAKGLTARQVETIREPGMHADGGGLYLQVLKGGGKTWVFRFKLGDKRRDMGLGSAAVVTLAEAREAAAAAKRQVAAGVDPIEARNATHQQSEVPTFAETALLLIEAKAPGWSNPKHAAQWTATLATHAFPMMGETPINAITTNDVLSVLNPIWNKTPETASRVRGRIEAVLDYGKARGWREGENPAAWRGHLALTLPAKSKVRRVKGHAAMAYADLPAFWPRLQAADGMGARALEFAILTAARSGEVRGATWAEIDLDAAIWTIPAERMKANREHRVPLTAPALALLRKMAAIRRGDLVFEGQRGKLLSDMTLAAVLKRMDLSVTPHGFRSTFRTWAAEQTSTPHEVAEAALAHATGNKVSQAYQRGDLLMHRRELMNQWAAYVEGGWPATPATPATMQLATAPI